jgi:hypothetical protein
VVSRGRDSRNIMIKIFGVIVTWRIHILKVPNLVIGCFCDIYDIFCGVVSWWCHGVFGVCEVCIVIIIYIYIIMT